MYFDLLQEYQGCVMKWLGSTDRKSSGCTNLTCVEGRREVVLGMVLWPVLLEAPADSDLAARVQNQSGRLSLFCKLRPFFPNQQLLGLL